MKTQLFVLEHQCLGYAVLAYQVADGLGCVLDDGVLPLNYQGVFLKAAKLCDDIARGGYKTIHSAQVEGISDETVWFSNLTKCHPEICKYFTTYEHLEGIAEALRHLARDDTHADSYPVEWVLTVQEFFLSLWVALDQECAKEGIVVNINPGIFPESSTNLQ